MWFVFVHKTFWGTTWDHNTTLSPERERGGLCIIQKDLLQQENILQKNGEVDEILTKEYQYKNSYQGKYCDPKNIYGPWYLKSTINSCTKHLFVFNLFDEENNYERIRF